MIGKNLEVTPTEALFLMILKNYPQCSGVLIVKKLNADLGEDWSPSPGATYKIINSLLRKNLIYDSTTETERTKIEEQHSSKYKEIKTYALTSKGEELLPKIASRLRKVVIFAKNCCPELSEDFNKS